MYVVVHTTVLAVRRWAVPTATDAECEEAARTLLAKGVGAVVMTLGERGAMLITPDADATRFAVPEEAMTGPIVDTIGAGTHP